MTAIQMQLWIDRPREALAFYQAAFAATVEHLVGDSDDIVAQLAIGDARFWIATADPSLGRFNPAGLGGATGRALLVVDDPDATVDAATRAGATTTSPVADEHGWRLGRIVDPFGHEWEIGHPT